MMPEFVLLCHDAKDALPTRLETRLAHLDHIAKAGDAVLLAGPLLDEEGRPKGSLLVIRMENEAAARDFADKDPYALAGVFDKVEIAPFRIVAGALAP